MQEAAVPFGIIHVSLVPDEDLIRRLILSSEPGRQLDSQAFASDGDV